MQIGGGINPDNAAGWLDAGASHVIVTSYVFQDGQLNEDRLQELVGYYKAANAVLRDQQQAGTNTACQAGSNKLLCIIIRVAMKA